MSIFTAAQSRRIDELAMDELAIPGIVLMENAGINATAALLDLVAEREGLSAPFVRAIVCCGSGNNGGDGYVIARHLHNWGAAVQIVATRHPDELHGDAAVMGRIALRMGLDITTISAEADADTLAAGWTGSHLLVDALLGTGTTGAPRGGSATLIRAINATRRAHGHLTGAIDIPSGLDPDTGQPHDPCIEADLTITFAAMKMGLAEDHAQPWTGHTVVADIGIPPGLVDRVAAESTG